MKLILRYISVIILLVVVLHVSSCQTGVTFDPKIHVGSYKTESIIYKDGDLSNEVACYDENFNNYGCIGIDQWKELAIILQKCEIDQDTKALIRKAVKQNIGAILQSNH